MKRLPKVLVVLVILILLLVFVWPTPYEYRTIDRFIHIRTNRFTGTEEADTPSGWVPAQRALE